jgi:FAD/FMN-containing dehydrogenase
MTDPGRLLERLRAIVGDRHCLTDPDLRASYEVDWTRRFGGRALAVIRPGSTDEVAAVLRACADAGIGVVPQGGNTGLVGGSIPRDGDVVLNMLRLRDVEPVDVAGEVSVGAGAALAAVQAHVRSAGWELGIDLAARDSATVGGMAATNAGGAYAVRYGSMRRQILGYEAALADGSVVRRLPGMPKDNTGYDLGGLLTGSEGTLGVFTRLRLRLVPLLRRRAVALLGLSSPGAAVAAGGELRRVLASLLALEIFDDAGLQLVMRHAGVRGPFSDRHPTYLLVEAADASVDPSGALAAAVEAVSPADAVLAADELGRRRLWELRERHTEAINAAGVPHKLDVAVPIVCVADFIDRVPAAVEAASPGSRVICFGHLADGNLHVNLLGPAPDDERADDAVLELVIGLGGSISAEHGIGRAKAGWLVSDRGEADVEAMLAIKRALDPAGIMNPGVIFPVEHRVAAAVRASRRTMAE